MDKKNELAHVSTQLTDQSIQDKFESAKSKTNNFNDFLNEFLLNFLSETTKRSYIKDLQLFFEFILKGGESIISPQDIKAYHFSLYRDWLIQCDYAPATINRRLVAIRSFMKWALANNLIEFNPLDSVKLPKVQTKTPTQAFDDDEVRLMLEAPNTKLKEGNSHRMILVLLLHLGLRRSELCKLQFKDIYQDRNHHALRIHSKGGKIRVVPIPKELLKEIYEYKARFESYNEINLNDDDYIIQTSKIGKNSSPCNGSTIYRVVNRYAKKLGIKKNVGAHSCRATVISHLLDTQKVQIREVADFAGHSQITTTQRYDKKRKGLDDSAAYMVDYKKEA